MLPIVKQINKFHDRKRRIRYKEVMKIIDEEDEGGSGKENKKKKEKKEKKIKLEEGKDEKINCENILDLISSFKESVFSN